MMSDLLRITGICALLLLDDKGKLGASGTFKLTSNFLRIVKAAFKVMTLELNS